MGDPLTLLKRHGKSAVLENDKIIFKGLAQPVEFPRTTVTRFRVKKNPSDHYTLDALWFCLQNIGVALPEYISACSREKITVVAIADKIVFDNFISGKVAEESLPKDVVDAIGPQATGSGMDMDISSEEIDGIFFFTFSAAVPSASSYTDEETVQKVLKSERTINTSKSLLVAPAKDFKSLFGIGAPAQTTSARPAHDRYQSRPENDFYSSMGLGTEDIDTRGSLFFSGSALGGGSSASAQKQSAPSSSSSNSRRRTGSALEQVIEANKKPKAALKPIIVVPGVVNSPVNRYNMVKFFGEGTFEEIDPNNPNLDDSVPHKVEIMRKKSNGEEVPYEIVDNTAKFTPSDWERVIAIFTIGKEWQFKAYPYKDRIADMFKKHCGIYVRLGTEKIPQDTIGNWNVKVLTISRSHRHTDAATMQDFWTTIDNFVLTSKIVHLKY